jgi:hypothetical protein
MKTIKEILNTHLFISSYNRSHTVYNVGPELYARYLSDVEEVVGWVDWDNPLYNAFIWGNTDQGHKFWERIDRG